MTLLDFVRDEAPLRCGVSRSFGKLAEFIMLSENNSLINTSFMDADKFPTARDRAKCAFPYMPKDPAQYERCIDIFEMKLLQHELEAHPERNAEARIMTLDATMMDDDKFTVQSLGSWWNS